MRELFCPYQKKSSTFAAAKKRPNQEGTVEDRCLWTNTYIVLIICAFMERQKSSPTYFCVG